MIRLCPLHALEYMIINGHYYLFMLSAKGKNLVIGDIYVDTHIYIYNVQHIKII